MLQKSSSAATNVRDLLSCSVSCADGVPEAGYCSLEDHHSFHITPKIHVLVLTVPCLFKLPWFLRAGVNPTALICFPTPQWSEMMRRANNKGLGRQKPAITHYPRHLIPSLIRDADLDQEKTTKHREMKRQHQTHRYRLYYSNKGPY